MRGERRRRGTDGGAAVTSGVKYSYTWKAGSKKVGSKSKLHLSGKWKGKKITVTVKASGSYYKSGSKTKTVTKKLK